MRVTIIGTDLPGRKFGDANSGCSYDDVHVGVQRGRDNEQLQPGDAERVRFTLELEPVGDRDARGAYAQGKKGERFIYLAWVAGEDAAMFRRAKLMLRDIPATVWTAAGTAGRREARLALTAQRGGPKCARVSPDLIEWRVPPR